MKQQAKITGPKVHDVGYRIFLMEAAMNCGVSRMSVNGWNEYSPQTVTCLAEGDETGVAAFKMFVESKNPEQVDVLNVTSEDYDGHVMHISEFAQICTCRILHTFTSKIKE